MFCDEIHNLIILFRNKRQREQDYPYDDRPSEKNIGRHDYWPIVLSLCHRDDRREHVKKYYHGQKDCGENYPTSREETRNCRHL